MHCERYYKLFIVVGDLSLRCKSRVQSVVMMRFRMLCMELLEEYLYGQEARTTVQLYQVSMI